MSTIDWPLLINWIVSGLIGLVFGVISAWIAYRYERKRDDIAWQREKEKLQQQHRHDQELLEIQFEQKIKELEQQLTREQTSQLRERLIQGIDNPQKTIETLQHSQVYIRSGGIKICVSPEPLRHIAAEFRQVSSESQDMLTRLQSKMANLNNDWEGMKAQPFYKEWEELVNTTSRQINILEDIAQQLINISEQFELDDSEIL